MPVLFRNEYTFIVYRACKNIKTHVNHDFALFATLLSVATEH